MREDERRALNAVQFNWTVALDEIWNPLAHHVDGLHPQAIEALDQAVVSATRRPYVTPMGIVLSGERGVGKTHMLGWLRQRVQREGGSFFLLRLLDERSFWAGAVHGVVNGLRVRENDQLGTLLDTLAERTGCPRELRMRLRGTIPVKTSDIDELVQRLGDLDSQLDRDCWDTLRALVLYRAKGPAGEVGHNYLRLDGSIAESERLTWGFRATNRPAQLLLKDLSHIFALAGPVVMAIDQIDTVITESEDHSRGQDLLVNRLADGLMRLRDETRRTIVTVACIPRSWELIEQRAVNSASDRFSVTELRSAMPSAEIASAIVEGHLGGLYGEIGFTPPYPTWPVRRSAFDGREKDDLTPRQLLQRVGEHVRWCLATDTVRELTSFSESTPAAVDGSVAAPVDLGAIDDHFAQLRAAADVVTPLDPEHEDERMSALLSAALRCHVLELGDSGQDLTVDPPLGVKPALHARLRRTLNEAREDEVHWGFRAIAHAQAGAVQARLRSACLESGLRAGSTKRHLVVLRNTAFSGGHVTKKMLADFLAAGGQTLPLSERDLRTFSALEAMLDNAPPGFQQWLGARRPASESELLSRVLPAQTESPAPSTSPAPRESAAPIAAPIAWPVEWPDDAAREPAGEPAATSDDPTIVIGRNVADEADFALPLAILRKHIAVFAGTGSGKTVLLRRLIEEAALNGVSSIVIDTNNDLARLGDAWPSRPAGWSGGDAERATRYLADTDVVVWTPRRETGRPLALNPLPDLGGVLDDPDEFAMSIEASVAGLVPRSGLTGRKINTGRAVLTQALAHFASNGRGDLRDFVSLLRDLPDEVSTVRGATKLAADIAEELNAAMINDPVFGGEGERLDPGVLLTPEAGKRARVSVVSCIGLPNEDQRQTFVNQLQLALFSWIKRNPATDRPLGGLLVLDEAQTFVSSRRGSASTESTLKLATQGRKYGLGMVYATQAPKALHNLVPGNSATQFFGRLNASVQIQTAKELARAWGGNVDDISRLPAGQFYGASEGIGFAKLHTPMCLSYHPSSALTEEEVLQRARKNRSA